MQKLKQGTAAIALVASLGLIVPGSFGGPASADIRRTDRVQPMEIQCDFDGDGVNEFTSDVISKDHDPGGQLATLQDTADGSSLVFHPQSGTVETLYAAIDHPFDAETDPEDVTPLNDQDPRLAGGYPAVFTILPDNPDAYLGGEFSRGGPKAAKKGLVDCVVTDLGVSDEGFQNWFGAGTFDAGITDCVVNGEKQNLCFVPPVLDEEGEFLEAVVYYYVDTYTIKAHVSNGGGANVKAASVDDGSSADRQHKVKKSGKQRGKGKRGR